MPKIILEPRNPLDVRPEDLEDLAEAVRNIDPSYEVEILPKEVDGLEPRFGVTFWEVIQIISYTADAAAVAALAKAAVDWARHRFKKQEAEQTRRHEERLAEYKRRGPKPKVHITHRPKYVEIYGPDGKVVKAVLIERPESEPEDRTSDASQSY
jgi:hypothetical protein